MQRPLRGLEKTMVKLGPVMGPDVVVGRVIGPLPVTVLRRAVETLQRQYATLRTRVDGDRLVVGGPVPVSVDVVAGDWQLFAGIELSRPLRLEAAEAFRVVFVPESGTVILSVHHALVDGTSLLVLLRDLLTHCASVLRGDLKDPDCVPLAPAVLESMNSPAWHGLLGEIVAAATPAVVAFEQHVVLGQGAVEGAVRSNVVFGEGTEQGFRRLRHACRVHGVTIGAAAMAAASFAMGASRARLGGPMLPTDVEVEVDLRRRSDPPIDPERVGFHTGGVRVDGADLDFWTLARSLGSRVHRQIDLGVPQLVHSIADTLTWAPRDAPGTWAAVSNLGRFAHPTQYGPLRLDAVYGMNGAVPGGPAAIFWLRTVGGRICFNAVGSSPTLDAAELERASSMFLGLLERPTAMRLEDCGRRGHQFSTLQTPASQASGGASMQS